MLNTTQFSTNALTVLRKRFLKKDAHGEPVETPQQMFRRVANNIALADSFYSATPSEVGETADEFYELMASLKFLPSTNCLRNAGRRLQQLFPCFVLPLEDSLESIYETLKNSALIFRTGGAVGISFSKLRPRGSLLDSTGGVSSGPVSFMKLFDVSTGVINEECMRYGGTMGLLRVDHPDILEFIQVKNEEGNLGNFNLSVVITDDFMTALEKGEDYSLFNPLTAQEDQKLSAEEVFEKLVASAWQSAEPGLIFIDEINRHNPTPQPLLPYEGCNLGAVSINRMVNDAGRLDYEDLKQVVHQAVHFLDNVIDVNFYVIPETREVSRGNRKVGLGIRGFAEALIKMGIAYNSDLGRKTAEELMQFIQKEACLASGNLARKRGNFPRFLGSVWDKRGVKYLRNATLTTLAPNGTTSLIADCTGGIEPIFGLVHKRRHMKTLQDQDLYYLNPEFKRVAEEKGFYSQALIEKISQTGSCQGVDEVPEEIQKIFVTAHDISPEDHVKMQSVFQKYTDNAVSKTVNLPENSTLEDVKKVYRLAYQLKCKGVTVYRDKSRTKQVLNKIKN